MKPIEFYFIILLAACSTTISAQLGDCTGAQLLETKEDVIFTFIESENQFSDIISPTCVDADEVFSEDDGLLTHWFTWTIEESGSLYFTLSMQVEFYDLDFILFKSAESGNPCVNKEAIRCMFSGSNVSGGMLDNQCSMSTGLSPAEMDLFENGGCMDGSNNFLQQIDVVAGEEYKLIVIDFSQIKGMEILLEWCGTATLGVNDTPCFTLATEELVHHDDFAVFPNPTNDQLFLSSNDVPTIINFPFTIVDQIGQVVMRKNDNKNLESIETSSLQPGIYFININGSETNTVLKFVKQ